MRTVGLISFLLVLILSIVYFLNGYKSAFEADQQCHYTLNTEYTDNSNYGCDHDLETRQWLLFKKDGDINASVVIKRFRY